MSATPSSSNLARRALRPALTVILLGGAFLLASLLAAGYWGSPPNLPLAARRARQDAGGPPPKLWPLPAFQGRTHEGRPFDQNALRGRTWVADFIYTSCTSACPVLTSRLLLVARGLSPRTGLVSFSVDPDRDTPETLAAYARRWSAQARPWTLVAMSANDVGRLATGMQVAVVREGAEGEIVHSSQFFVIDREGWVRGAYDSAVDEELAALSRDVAMLEGAPLASGENDGPADGAQLLLGLGCAGCHADARIAPPLRGLSGRIVLEDGSEVERDTAYLRESILSPGTKLVKGYGPTMPSYASVLGAAQLEALVQHLAAQHGTEAAAPVQNAVDPVCGMRVVVTASTPHAESGVETHWFCSETCRARYLASKSAPRAR